MPRGSAKIDDDVMQQAAEVLRVLAHRDRLRIVEALLRGRLSVGDLAARLDLPPAATSQHLSHMRAHGILEVQRDGRAAYYRVINPNAARLIECIRQHGDGRGRPAGRTRPRRPIHG